jgi:hypothetical protein
MVFRPLTEAEAQFPTLHDFAVHEGTTEVNQHDMGIAG